MRREARGSYLARHPYLQEGHQFARLVVDFFLMANKKWGTQPLIQTNPMVRHRDNKAFLYRDDMPILNQEPFAVISDYPLKSQEYRFFEMRQMAQQAFLVLEKAWHQAGHKLVELHLRFGLDGDGNLLIADPIDHDSWHLSAYEEKKGVKPQFSLLKPIKQNPPYTANIFKLPKQQLVIWLTQENQNINHFLEDIKKYLANDITISTVQCSALASPLEASQKLLKLSLNAPNAVILVFDNKGAHSSCFLAEQTLIPVICISEAAAQLITDSPVISASSNATARTIALQILSKQNPRLYAQLQLERMDRMKNIITLS